MRHLQQFRCANYTLLSNTDIWTHMTEEERDISLSIPTRQIVVKSSARFTG